MRLKEYCDKNGISLSELAEMSGVSVPGIYDINKGGNVTIETINKIYEATKKRFGAGLRAEEYTDLYK